VLFFIQLVTDLDLLLPLLYELDSKKDTPVQPMVSIAAELLQRSPGVRNALTSRQIPFEIAGTEEIIAGNQPNLHGVVAVVTATETTLRPHKAAHSLTQRANSLGIPTYTLQHGFENVGLTYFDEFQTSTMVEFASQTIFTWGPIGTLHREVRPETQARCVPVGCCKSLERSTTLPRPGGRSRLIAVFENIHWLRYDDMYRRRFLSDLTHAARCFPDTTFLIKPHPGGKWLTSRYTGDLPGAENLIIANPDDAAWARYTTVDLIGFADGVITTPSTVALDSARLGCPVAVVAYQLALAEYTPLNLLRSTDDWKDFVRSLENQGEITALKQNASDFLDAILIPGDAAGRIIDRIVADTRRILPSTANRDPELSCSEKPK
jgi:hypothetical protein